MTRVRHVPELASKLYEKRDRFMDVNDAEAQQLDSELDKALGEQICGRFHHFERIDLTAAWGRKFHLGVAVLYRIFEGNHLSGHPLIDLACKVRVDERDELHVSLEGVECAVALGPVVHDFNSRSGVRVDPSKLVLMPIRK